METINVVVNDDKKTVYRQTDDDGNLPTKPFVAPELTVADVPTVDTSVNNCGDSSKSTQKEVMADVSETVPSSHV
ncbi:uncharacterized protein E5676_scaffold121G00610 [Cucumis melo var. makuwa]|uniref:Uncharacterized protein n=1 Tax=Cucumis melo var. makuwa TaxID=1194695 RepID=A0A5A7SU41_CUCMM|nr:uncharacterized protein E6C27_scaffold269G001460 [Cucumis melo var. makuwa]TYK03456.1 uncharacterized protein E5676_scaffold121G00610 [Cucumis melo var. makuwa]